ncbi:hypothetical protein N7495_004101 [Penicillium taxi]|uniref:uncharacterized protein n=1 Tax=Penicillium taxi TaxID=168475 RepID=UPI0025459845|nr:uncharacterized protein N7495_004101 [Penicillium taxi]KAJ5899357.1 hypothetical protein N7495_004101 [Penicillium taxi]
MNNPPNFYSKQQGSTHPEVDGRLPLLMQRPKNLSIDVTGFSFAKESSHSKEFGSQAPPKHSLVNSSNYHGESLTKMYDRAKDTASETVNQYVHFLNLAREDY